MSKQEDVERDNKVPRTTWAARWTKGQGRRNQERRHSISGKEEMDIKEQQRFSPTLSSTLRAFKYLHRSHFVQI